LRQPIQLATVPFTMTRAGSALLTLVGGACLAIACSGASPRDINFNTDAESGFEPPPRETASDTSDADDVDAAAGAAGAAGGAAGAAGAAGGAAGATAGSGGGTAGEAAGASGAGGGAAGAAGGGVSDGGNA
jgi:hypothetical protein